MCIQAHAQSPGSTQGPEQGSTCGHSWWDSDSHLPRTPPCCPARPVMGGPPHVQQGTHMLISVPTVQEAGVGGLSTQSPGCCQNPSESCPPTPGPHLRLWRSQQQVRIPTPPNSLTLGRLLFHNLSQRLELGDCSPCLPPGPPPTGAQLLLPPSVGKDGA